MRIVSWNMAHKIESWYQLISIGADIALIQEAVKPPADLSSLIQTDDQPWFSTAPGLNRPWRTAVVKISNRVDVKWYKPVPLDQATALDISASRVGTLAAADVTSKNGFNLTVISMYALWERLHPSTKGNWIYADGSVHRLISDISAFIGTQNNHQILASADLNILFGYGENGSRYWAERYKTIFDRMSALGLVFMGPQFPYGQQADPWPNELPPGSLNVPTFYTSHQNPSTATRQLDFVFTSKKIMNQTHVRAMNNPDEWGSSDHCKVVIDIDTEFS